MDWDTVCNMAIEYFQENDDEFATSIEDLDSYMGYFEDERYYPMSFLDEFFYNHKASDILDDISSDFDTSDEYFVVSMDYAIYSTNGRDYSSYLNRNFIETLYKYKDKLRRYTGEDLPEYINKLFEAYDEEEYDDEEEEE